MHARIAVSVIAVAGLLLAAWPSASASPTPAGYETINGVLVDARLASTFANPSAVDRVYAIVGYDHPPTASDVSALQGLGLTVVAYRQLSYAAVGGTSAAVAATTGLPGVTSLHANRAVYPLASSAPDPSAMARDTNAYGTGISTVFADKAWALGVTGSGIGVAVIDTGIDTTNPSLAFEPAGPVAENVNILSDELLLYPDHNVEVFQERMVTTDTFGHGTHVSGSVAGSGVASNGLFVGAAPGAHLVGLTGLQCAIIGEAVGCLVTILSAFDYVLINQARFNIRVNTNSWGSGPGAYTPLDPISVAVNSLVAHDIVVLFAAGNDGPDADTQSAEARNPNVIAVAAGQPSGGLVEFSSRGVAGGVTPTITSPGHLIISSRAHSGIDMQQFTVAGFDAAAIPPEFLPNYLVAQGTSMATPVAAGVVALIRSANPALSVTQVRDLVTGTATPMLGYAPFEVGAGYINAEAAVRSALGKSWRATSVKTPAQTTITKSGGETLLTHDYRASIAGVGLLGFAHFAFSFPVYNNEARPIDIHLRWQTIQAYSIYTTGYRVRIYDPTLTQVARFDTDFFDLSQGATFSVNATMRATHTPATGAYWYMDMVNFNPGWGILEMSPTVHYSGTFKPPFRTEKSKPAKVSANVVGDPARPGNGAEVQGTVTDANGQGLDGITVSIQLTGPLGLVRWQGTTTSVNGVYTSRVPISSGTPPGTYTVRATSGDASGTDTVTVDATPPTISYVGVSFSSPGSVTVTAAGTDTGGLAYFGVDFTNGATGVTRSVFLTSQADGRWTGSISLEGSGVWGVAVTASDRAGNTVSASTTISL